MTGEQDDAHPGAGRHEEVGSLGEEAARLLGVLGEWAQERTDTPPGAGGARSAGGGARGLADQLADAVHRVDEHVDTGAPECTWCPVCRVVHVVRQTSPEVRDHLAAAAGSLLEAASALLATHVPADRARPGGEGRVERIDLDEDPEDPRP